MYTDIRWKLLERKRLTRPCFTDNFDISYGVATVSLNCTARNPLAFLVCLFLSIPPALAEESNLDPIKGDAEGNEAPADEKKIESDPLRAKVAEAIEISKRRYLDAKVHTPWQIMHGMLALRQDYEIKRDGKKINTLDWIQQGQSFNRQPWVEKTRYGGRFHTYTKPYHFEGHPNQFLAILTMSDLPAEFTFGSRQGPVSIQQMIEHAKMVVNDREEQTWTLWALSKYLPSDASWTNNKGEQWSIERLVQMQTHANFNKAACGGTHGLFALAHARKHHVEAGNELNGVWIEADQTIKKYINIARALQYSDGTFSCGYFAYKDYKKDFAERLSPTGHTLEFLMMAVADEDLQKDWIRKGVEAVADDLIDNRRRAVDCGPLYHALDGLVLYLERTAPEKPEEQIVDEDFTPLRAPKPPEAIARQSAVPRSSSAAE